MLAGRIGVLVGLTILLASSITVVAYAQPQCNGGPNQPPHCDPLRGEHGPFGHVDEVTSNTSEGLRIRGWAIDPDTDRPINVRLLVDGQLREELTADLDRPDVGARHGYGNLHGFDVTLKPVVREGVEYNRRHTSVCVIGVNIGRVVPHKSGVAASNVPYRCSRSTSRGEGSNGRTTMAWATKGVMEDLAPELRNHRLAGPLPPGGTVDGDHSTLPDFVALQEMPAWKWFRFPGLHDHPGPMRRWTS